MASPASPAIDDVGGSSNHHHGLTTAHKVAVAVSVAVVAVCCLGLAIYILRRNRRRKQQQQQQQQPHAVVDTVADRPLLLLHDDEEGNMLYDLLLVADDEEEMVAVAGCSPRPVARFPSPSGCRAFAVSGGAILGAFYDRGYKDAPTMLPLSAGTVVRLDTILFDGIYGVFEKLWLLPGGSWHAVPLPKPPVGRLAENELAFVSAYCAVGTRVWISVAGKGTFSLDVADERSSTATAWRTEGIWIWQLPFQGRGLHVPELGSVVIALTADDKGLLCACDVGTWAVRQVWPETFPSPWEECVITSGGRVSRPRDMPSLCYLGDGRFGICRPMSTMEPTMYGYGPPITYDTCCFLVVELKRCSSSSSSSSSGLQLAKRGRITYMWPPGGRPSPYLGFVQPAT